jgi:tetratricopeptide (TPR) repeat protein
MRRAVRVVAGTVLAGAVFVAGALGPFRVADTRARGGGPGSFASTGTGSLAPPVLGGSLDRVISSLQERLRSIPTDWRSFASLGLAYVQQARITTDPTLYPKAEGALRRSIRIHPDDNEVAWVGMASLAAARHDFAGALRWGERARRVNPYDGNVYGVIGDAQLELGRYRQAFATFQTMVDTRPGLASYARASYVMELRGDVPGAIRAMTSALRFAGSPADAAWASYQLGELFFNSGRVGRARAAYRRALQADPDSVPPLAGLAKVAWARGNVRAAIRGYTRVTARVPSPEYVIALGDLYGLVGDEAAAARQYDLVRVEERLFRANGVNIDLEQALFEADHGDPVDALRAARHEWGRRHSIHVADALAWALFANGRYAEASGFERRALALGTRSALFLFHAGMIQRALGHDGAARRLLHRALDVNPHFSIRYAGRARAILDGLETSR